ncbi:MAG: hypothetical protein ACRCYP_04550 [Alphaproteobacteria bacterium]
MAAVIEEDLLDTYRWVAEASRGGFSEFSGLRFVLPQREYSGMDRHFATSDRRRKIQGTAYVGRVLSNPLINPLSVMKSFILEITQMMAEQGKTVILCSIKAKFLTVFNACLEHILLPEITSGNDPYPG